MNQSFKLALVWLRYRGWKKKFCAFRNDSSTVDDDELTDGDILAPANKEHQPQGIDSQATEKLEKEAFALLKTILQDDEPIDEDILVQARKKKTSPSPSTRTRWRSWKRKPLCSRIDVTYLGSRIEFTFSNIGLY